MLNKVTDKSIDEKGERMVPAFHEKQLVYGEHISRYLAASEIIKNKIVLDIASGSGYGSSLLSENASFVYGVDNDKQSIDYSKRNYKKSNIEFRLGTAENIPLKDSSVDAVVSFETIEHIEDFNLFLKEIKRVLKKDGFLIISTPNDYEFPEGNHFHKHEFYPEELKKLLSKHYKYTKHYYQVTWIYNAILNEHDAQLEWLKPINTYNAAPVEDNKAVYLMAVCTNSAITKDFEIRSMGVTSEHYSARAIQEEKHKIDKEIKMLKTDIKNKNRELSSIYNSRGWKLLDYIYNTKIKLKKILVK